MKVFSNDTAHITLEDIQRYKSNEMSSEEMHRFEQHLLGCEFCDEAYEGYLEDKEGDQGEIFQRLHKQLAKRTIKKKFPGLMIAAVVGVLLCASVVWVFMFNGQATDEVSILEKPVNSESSSLIADTAKSADDGIMEENKRSNKIPNEPIPEEPKETKPIKEKRPVPKPQPKVQKLAAPREEEPEAPVVAEHESEQALQEVVVVESDEGVDLAQSDEAVSGRSAFQEKVLTPTQKEKLQKQRISRRKLLVSPAPMSQKETTLSSQNAIPVVGFAAYRLYLSERLRYPESARNADLQGEVKLKFKINQKGDIIDMTVEEGLSEACDEEAKRLVLEGPKWKLANENLPDENNIVNLTIDFDLK